MNGKGIHIVSRIVGGILLVLFAGALALRSKNVQSRIRHMVEQKIEKVMDADVSFSSIGISPYGALHIEDILIKDLKPYTADSHGKGYAPTDTILYAKTISATFTLKGLLSDEGLHLGRVNVTDGGIFIVTEPEEETGRHSNIEAVTGPKKQIDPDYVAQPGPDIFDIRKVKIDNFRFRLINFTDKKAGKVNKRKKERKDPRHGINYENMDVTANVRAHAVKMTGGKMHGIVDHCEAFEKCGFHLEDVTGNAAVGLGVAMIEDLHINADRSDIKMSQFSMSFKNMLDFKDFVNKVVFDAEFQPSLVAMGTINYFCDFSLGNNELLFDISSGHVHGPVNDLDTKGLCFKDIYSGMSGLVDARVGSIVPDVSTMKLEADARDVRFNSSQISEFLTCWSQANGGKVDFSKIAPGTVFSARACCSGTINRLAVGATLQHAEVGKLSVEGLLRDVLNKPRPISMTGHVVTDGLSLDKLTGIEKTGLLDAEARLGLELNKPADISIDTLVISRLNALGHDFKDISLKGEMKDNTVSLFVSSKDSALITETDVLMDLNREDGQEQRIKLNSELALLDLHALGLDKRGDVSTIAGQISANFTKKGNGINGEAFLREFRLLNDNGHKDIGEIAFRASEAGGEQHFRLDSPFAEGNFSGSGPLAEFIQDIQDLTIRRHLQAIPNKAPLRDSSGRYELNLDFHDTRDLMAYVMPSLYIADSTNVVMSVDDGIIQAGISSPRLALGTKFVRRLSIDFDNMDNSLNTFVTTDEFNSGGFILRNPAIATYAADNNVEFSLQFNGISNSDSEGELFIDGSFSRDETDSLVITAQPLNSYIRTGKDIWEFEDSRITLKGKDIRIDSLQVAKGLEKLFINGGYSRTKKDTLSVALDSLNIKVIDEFLVNRMGLNGIMTGKAIITSPTEKAFGMLLNFSCDSLNIGGTDVGSFKIESKWDETAQLIRARIGNNLRGKEILQAGGSYKPTDKQVDLTANFNDFALSAAAPFLHSVISETGGTISGEISATGKIDKLDINSKNLHLKDALIKVGYTGVPYTINGPIRIEESGIYLDKLDIRDSDEGRGSLSGSMRYRNFKDIRLNADAILSKLQVIDLKEYENNSLYGKLNASGKLSIAGPLNSLAIDADISTSGDGDLHIPLSGALTSTRSNLLTFTESERILDPYEQMLQEYKEIEKKTSNDLTARGSIHLSNGLKAFLEIDKSIGNIMTVSGDGTIGLELRPAKSQFTLNGDYNIKSGNYHFVLPGIMEKDFDIKSNSSIRFGGDMKESQINIEAIHPVKTSLSTLLADSTVVGTRRLVECGLTIGNKLSKPEIKFSINIPDLDPTTKSKVDGALNTDDKVQTQFVALLLGGTFLPSEQSGVFNGSNILYSNIGEVVSSQINNILQKLSIPVDIGLGYQQQNGGNSVFDVAVSTQLFNNRVVVNGTVGSKNKKYATSSGSSDIVGDLDIEFKLDKEGKYRVSAFSHSADGNTNFLDNSQRNGIGVSFQQEFNTFKEFIRGIFVRAKKNEGMEAIQELANKKENMKVIKIENEQTVPDSLSVGRQ